MSSCRPGADGRITIVPVAVTWNCASSGFREPGAESRSWYCAACPPDIQPEETGPQSPEAAYWPEAATIGCGNCHRGAPVGFDPGLRGREGEPSAICAEDDGLPLDGGSAPRQHPHRFGRRETADVDARY